MSAAIILMNLVKNNVNPICTTSDTCVCEQPENRALHKKVLADLKHIDAGDTANFLWQWKKNI